MRLGLYAVRDKVAMMVVGVIFLERNPASAARQFSNACRDTQSAMSKTPGDYELLQVAEMDDSSGAILVADPADGGFPRVILDGGDVPKEAEA